MLVLSRQRDQKVILTLPSGVKLEVCVVDIRGDKVRLGFSAPDDITIHRWEVQEAIERGEVKGKVNL